MRLSQILWFTGIAIVIGISIPHLPKPFFLRAQTTNSTPEADSTVLTKPDKESMEKSRSFAAVNREEPENPPIIVKPQGAILQSLNLNAEQKRQLRTARQSFQPQIRERRLKILEAQAELDEMLAGTATDAVLKAKFQQVSQLRQDVQQLQFESVLAMRQILTPEQRKQFAAAMEKRREVRKQRRQNPNGQPLKEKE